MVKIYYMVLEKKPSLSGLDKLFLCFFKNSFFVVSEPDLEILHSECTSFVFCSYIVHCLYLVLFQRVLHIRGYTSLDFLSHYFFHFFNGLNILLILKVQYFDAWRKLQQTLWTVVNIQLQDCWIFLGQK